jgi:1-acyl-sn-glycerol-3-phosphate acyltransferase
MLPYLARICLRLAGWTVVGKKPDVPKMVITAYPHTSNWDLVVYILTAWVLGIPLSWMGKDVLFRGLSGVLLRPLGGIAIHRDRRENVVEQMKRNFSERDELCLLIAPEGTRSYVPHLKSGFYHIAVSAGVPIAPSFIDYARKEAGMLGLVEPTGDVRKDMDRLRELYRGRVARYPECVGEVRLREEDGSGGSAPTSALPDR